MERLACIGLEPNYLKAVKSAYPGIVVPYDVPPPMYSHQGKLYAESFQVAGRWLPIDRLIWYGYYPEDKRAAEVRRAIALSYCPAYPDIDLAVLHDDRVLSLILASRADTLDSPMARGYLPRGNRVLLGELSVLKIGNDHCGDGKLLIDGLLPETEHSGIVEPFITGDSVRVLVIGEWAWVLRYESTKPGEWRKNVQPKVTEIQDEYLKKRGLRIAQKLGLPIVGIDFIGTREEEDWKLLEVNAYPGLDDAPLKAQTVWEETLCRFASGC
jgi:hypothetical protein